VVLNNAWFDGRSRPLVLFSLAANLTASSLVVARMWRTRGRRGLDAAMAVAILAVLLLSFWPESWFMVFWAIGVENLLCVLGAVLSTFSFGIGPRVWPAMLIALLAGRAPPRVLAACAALATVCVAGFLWGLPGRSAGVLVLPVTQPTTFFCSATWAWASCDRS
jgi:hypothetical protein